MVKVLAQTATSANVSAVMVRLARERYGFLVQRGLVECNLSPRVAAAGAVQRKTTGRFGSGGKATPDRRVLGVLNSSEAAVARRYTRGAGLGGLASRSRVGRSRGFVSFAYPPVVTSTVSPSATALGGTASDVPPGRHPEHTTPARPAATAPRARAIYLSRGSSEVTAKLIRCGAFGSRGGGFCFSSAAANHPPSGTPISATVRSLKLI